jgi:hypothetical protein
MDFSSVFQIKKAWDRFCAAHPQFPLFLQAVRDRNVLREGTVVEIIITPAGGDPIRSKTRISADDVELFHEVSSLAQK